MAHSVPKPSRAEVWMVQLDPIRGHEQAGTRPALVISADPFNHGPAGLVIVLPITTTDRRLSAHVPILPPDGGLDRPSFAMTEMIRSVSVERLTRRRGAVPDRIMAEVEQRLRFLLGL